MKGCPLDTDGDGNCQQHPLGCPITEPVIPPHVLEVARARAAQSPCAKSKRGAVIFDPADWSILAHANNHLPGGRPCALAVAIEDRDRANPRATFGDAEACRQACGVRCVHAEARAILDVRPRMRGIALEILHVKVVEGVVVASGAPSCVPCAALILEAGLAACWLLHAEGWRRYGAGEFYRLSCEARGLPSG